MGLGVNASELREAKSITCNTMLPYMQPKIIFQILCKHSPLLINMQCPSTSLKADLQAFISL